MADTGGGSAERVCNILFSFISAQGFYPVPSFCPLTSNLQDAVPSCVYFILSQSNASPSLQTFISTFIEAPFPTSGAVNEAEISVFSILALGVRLSVLHQIFTLLSPFSVM